MSTQCGVSAANLAFRSIAEQDDLARHIQALLRAAFFEGSNRGSDAASGCHRPQLPPGATPPPARDPFGEQRLRAYINSRAFEFETECLVSGRTPFAWRQAAAADCS